MYTGFATQFWSYGASDFEAGRCALAAPASLQATSDFISGLRDAGPSNWLDQRWYELALDFARGRYALLVDSDHYVAYFEEPAYSELVGGIGYAPPPLGPTGSRWPNLWTWSVVMNSRVHDRDAAWRFVEWATGREFLLRSVFEGNMNPTRSSIWDDEGFREHTSGWGGFYEVARTLIRARRVRTRHALSELPRDRKPVGPGAARCIHRARGDRRRAQNGSSRHRRPCRGLRRVNCVN
jgi:multiple sugar transport system substrate-binding protein